MKELNKQILEAINRGINLALDSFEAQDDIQQLTHGNIKNEYNTKLYLDLMNYVVDLGLPSGTLWCKFNMGCNRRFDFDRYKHERCDGKSEWYGNYYAWGELDGLKNIYRTENYAFAKQYAGCSNHYSMTKYTKFGDEITLLLPEDDVVLQKFHIGNLKFHIPTKELACELIQNIKSEWKHDYLGYDGLNGLLFISKINGNSIFFPAAGYYIDILKNSGKIGCYWTSTLSDESSDEAYCFWFADDGGIREPQQANHLVRYEGLSIRPVINLR